MTYTRILLFWLPLAATWLMMSAEGPFLSAVIARMAEPKFNLAAFGVAFSIAMATEAPIIMMLATANTLVRDRDSLIKVRRFMYAMNGIVTCLIVMVVTPPVFYFIVEGLMRLPEPIARLTHTSCVFMIPWPAAIGYRRFYQGVLIRHNRTRYVAYGTVVRLSSMAISAILFYSVSSVEGSCLGALSLSIGVTLEAIATRLWAREVVRKVLTDEGQVSSGLTYRAITVFFVPLALTTIIALGARPMVTFFMGQSRMPVESLAVLPVVQSVLFLFSALGISFQEAVIALVGDRYQNYRLLRDFALVLGIVTVCGFGLLSFTFLSGLWFQQVAGLSSELASFAVLPAQIMTAIPGLWVVICFQRAILMNARRTGVITQSTILEVIIIFVALLILIRYLDAMGAVAAAGALLAGVVTAPSYLFRPFLKILKERKA